jgi:ferric-dicitrate binding protein FerR (iron transport regulator)
MDEERRKRNEKPDDVGALLRLAGKREPLPQQRFDRVRAAAHGQWRKETRGRKRQRILWTAASLLAAASAVFFLIVSFLPRGGGESQPYAAVRIEALSGLAQLREPKPGSGSRFCRAAVGDEIAAGSEIFTLGEGRAALRLVSGHSMRLDGATKIRWHGGNSFDLTGGAVYVDSGAEVRSGSKVAIRTPFGSVHDVGTQFEVRLTGESIRLRLREGAVVLHGTDGVHEVAAGTELKMTLDGDTVRRTIAPDGPEWDWVTAIAPMPDLDGRSAHAFLEWVAREHGWTLTFADETLARTAEEVLLDGSFSQLTPDQALDAVLPTCRMSYRIDAGKLIVSTDAAD